MLRYVILFISLLVSFTHLKILTKRFDVERISFESAGCYTPSKGIPRYIVAREVTNFF